MAYIMMNNESQNYNFFILIYINKREDATTIVVISSR